MSDGQQTAAGVDDIETLEKSRSFAGHRRKHYQNWRQNKARRQTISPVSGKLTQG